MEEGRGEIKIGKGQMRNRKQVVRERPWNREKRKKVQIKQVRLRKRNQKKISVGSNGGKRRKYKEGCEDEYEQEERWNGEKHEEET